METSNIDFIWALVGMTVTLLATNWAMFRGLRTELKGDMDSRFTEIKSDIRRLEDKVDARFEAMDAKVDDLRTELKEDNQRLEDKMDARFEAMDAKMDARFEAMDAKVDDLRKETRAETRRVGGRIDAVNETLVDMNSRLSRLEGAVFGIEIPPPPEVSQSPS